MSDKFPQKVQIVEDSGREWAKESTLATLVASVGVSNKLLKTIGGEKSQNISLTNLKKFEGYLGDTAGDVRSYGKAHRDLSNTLSGFTKSMYANATTVARTTANLASNADSASGFMRTLGQASSQVVGAIGGMGRTGAVAAAAITAVGVAASIVVDRVMASREAFMSMTQAGLYFSGNSLEFAARVRESGLELQQFTSIAEKYNVALLTSAGAESGYLRQVRELGGTFDRLNLSVKDGAEYFAEFLDQSRLSNAAYMQDEKAQREAFEKNAQIQQELARISGVTLRQQREQARGMAGSRQMQALMAARPQDAARISRAAQNVGTATGLDQQKIDELSLFALEGRPLRGDLLNARQLNPEMFDRLVQEIRTGGTEESGRQLLASQQAAGQAFQGSQLARFVGQMMQGTNMSGAAGLYMDMMTRARQIDVNRPGATPGGGAGQPIDAQTQQVNAAVSDILRAVGALDAEVIRKSSEALGLFRTQIDQMREALKLINTENITSVLTSLRETMTSIGAILGPIGQALSGLSSQIQSVTGVGAGGQLAALAGVGATAYLGTKAVRVAGALANLGRASAPAAGATAGAAGAATRAVGGSIIRRYIPGAEGIMEGYDEYMQTGSMLRGLAVGGASVAGGLGGAALGAAAGPVGSIVGGYAGSQAGAAGARQLLGPRAGNTVAPVAPVTNAPPAAPNFFNDAIQTMEDGFQSVADGITLLNTRFADDGPVMRELNRIASNTYVTQKILNERS